MKVYLDTSAAMKLLAQESESAALAGSLDGLGDGDLLLSSWLLHTELHCAAVRRGRIESAAVAAVVDPVLLVDVQRSDLIGAAESGSGLRSQDAIHLAVALRTEADAIVTYDQGQAAAARAAGLEVLQPA